MTIGHLSVCLGAKAPRAKGIGCKALGETTSIAVAALAPTAIL